MSLEWFDVPALAAAALLLYSGLPKIADPRPIAATFGSLYEQVAGRWVRRSGSPAGLLGLGRLLGVLEVGVAAWVVVAPSWGAAAALGLLGAGFAAAGLIGASMSTKVACACLGSKGRPLGYRHAAVLPVWVAVAWSVARPGGLASWDDRLLVLAVCVGCVSWVYVLRMWAAVVPLARDRRRAAMGAASVWRVAHGEAEWLLPR